jgi:hypothetical protein
MQSCPQNWCRRPSMELRRLRGVGTRWRSPGPLVAPAHASCAYARTPGTPRTKPSERAQNAKPTQTTKHTPPGALNRDNLATLAVMLLQNAMNRGRRDAHLLGNFANRAAFLVKRLDLPGVDTSRGRPPMRPACAPSPGRRAPARKCGCAPAWRSWPGCPAPPTLKMPQLSRYCSVKLRYPTPHSAQPLQVTERFQHSFAAEVVEKVGRPTVIHGALW